MLLRAGTGFLHNGGCFHNTDDFESQYLLPSVLLRAGTGFLHNGGCFHNTDDFESQYLLSSVLLRAETGLLHRYPHHHCTQLLPVTAQAENHRNHSIFTH